MKKSFFIWLFAVIFALSGFWGFGSISFAKESQSVIPKNVIILIGDGMGQNQVHKAHEYIEKNLNMENMPYRGTSNTNNFFNLTTDSAAGATAIACGIRTLNGVVGLNFFGQEVENIREFLVKRGKKTGLVSTVHITDATPAAFGAHTLSRNNKTEIAEQFIENEIDVLLGGGSQYFSAALKSTALSKGYTIISEKDQLFSFEGDKLLALFTFGDFPYVSDGYPDYLPTLEEMTRASIEILRKSANGFFLMVEGGNIDHTGYDNKLTHNTDEVLAFDQAVKAAMDFAKEDGETLVIVTADHETGGLVKEGDSYKFTTTGHTNEPVFVFAMGPGGELFQGDILNTDICNNIKKIFLDTETTQDSQPSITGCQTNLQVTPLLFERLCLQIKDYMRKLRQQV